MPTNLQAMDPFMLKKLEGIKRTFDGLTERLADPDMANDRKAMLACSRERAGMEPTVEAYIEWSEWNKEKEDLVELDQDDDTDAEMREMCRAELKELEEKLESKEEDIKVGDQVARPLYSICSCWLPILTMCRQYQNQ